MSEHSSVCLTTPCFFFCHNSAHKCSLGVWLEAVVEVAAVAGGRIGLWLLRLKLRSLLWAASVAAMDSFVVFILHLWILCTIQADMLVFATWEGTMWVVAVVPRVADLSSILPTLGRSWGVWRGYCHQGGSHSGSWGPVTLVRYVGQTETEFAPHRLCLTRECHVPESGVYLCPGCARVSCCHLAKSSVIA